VPTDRLAVVLRVIAELGDDAGSVVDRVCAASVSLLSLTGAGLTLMIDGRLRETAGVSDAQIAALQEIQLTLGEGPCLDAARTGAPVLEPELAEPASSRWPAFGPAAIAAGVQAVLAFPLRFGAVGIGVLALYRDRPGTLTDDELAYGLLLADVATHVVLDLQAGAPADTLHELLVEDQAHWAEVHQATGMLSVQLGVPSEEAFVRLRARAFAVDKSVRAVAHQVVSGQLRLDG
jgi:GAF domain-containing protein